VREKITEKFYRDEFACKCLCGYDDINIPFVNALQVVRSAYGKPIRISSACRCEAHNKAVNGSDSSSHKLGFAADIILPESATDTKILITLCLRHFRRVFIYKTFIHVDCDPEKDQDVCRVY